MTLRSPSNISRHSRYKVSALKRPADEAGGEEEVGVDVIQRREAKRILSRIMSDKHVIEQNLKDYKPFGDKWTKMHEGEESQEYIYYEDPDPSSPQRSDSADDHSMTKHDR